MQTAAWMLSKGTGRGKGFAGPGVLGIQFPAACLMESFKTEACPQETERRGLQIWSVIETTLFRKEDAEGLPGTARSVSRWRAHLQQRKGAISRELQAFVSATQSEQSSTGRTCALQKRLWGAFSPLFFFVFFFFLFGPCPPCFRGNAAKGSRRAAVTRGRQRPRGGAQRRASLPRKGQPEPWRCAGVNHEISVLVCQSQGTSELWGFFSD